MENKKQTISYARFLLMMILSFISMYILMYAMVDSFSNVYSNYNQFYMAGLMTSPMVILEIVLMNSMYLDKKLNYIIFGLGIVALVGFYLCIRQQTAISDKQFLKSMIPHHAGALLMCEESDIHDPEIKELCEKIKSGQKLEIEQMKKILDRLEK